MPTIDPIFVGDDAFQRLATYCADSFPDSPITLVADTRTFAAAGENVARVLAAAGRALRTVILRGDNLHADEHGIARVLTASPYGEALFVAVGSGTITDITRYVSFRLGMPFVSVPTAASVDGYTSAGAPLVIEGIKRTHYSQPPLAIFADPAVVKRAPAELTAAGVGDMLGKITAAADWRLGALLWGESYDEAIALRSRAAAQTCIDTIDEIAQHSDDGLRRLMEALVESGLCMLDFGESRPASGAEHHISHLWEMGGLQDGGPQPLHGAQVGVATILVARLYARLRELTRADAGRLLETPQAARRAEQTAEIEAGYGSMAPTIVAEHAGFLEMSADREAALRSTLLERWDDVQAILSSVPEAQLIERLLRRVGGPTTTAELGLSEARARSGFLYGHYLRERFTVAKLAHLLGVLSYPL